MGDSNFGQFLYYLTSLVITFGFSWAVVAVAATLTVLHIGVQKLSEKDPPIIPLGDRRVFGLRPGSPPYWIIGGFAGLAGTGGAGGTALSSPAGALAMSSQEDAGPGGIEIAPRIVAATSNRETLCLVCTIANHPLEALHDIKFGPHSMLLPKGAFWSDGNPSGKDEAAAWADAKAVKVESWYKALSATQRASSTDPRVAVTILNAPFNSNGKTARAANRTITAAELASDPTRERLILMEGIRSFELGSRVNAKITSWEQQIPAPGEERLPIGAIKDGWTIASQERVQLHEAFQAYHSSTGKNPRNFGYAPAGNENSPAAGRPGESGLSSLNLNCGMYYDLSGTPGSLDALLNEMADYGSDFRRGCTSTKDGDLLEKAGMKATGMSWLVVLLKRTTEDDVNRGENDSAIWFRSLPNITVNVERSARQLVIPGEAVKKGQIVGTPHPDFRRDAQGFVEVKSGGAWIKLSRHNAALALYDYMRRYTPYGRAVEVHEDGPAKKPSYYARINVDSVRDAAIACEDYVGAGGVKTPLGAHGAVNLNAPPDAVINQLAMAMNMGAVTEIAGERFFHVGRGATVAKTLTEDDIVKDSWQYTPGGQASERPSAVKTHFIDALGRQQEVGVRREGLDYTYAHDVELQFVNNKEQATQVARIFMERSQDGHQMTLALKDFRDVPKPNDVIAIELPALEITKDERWRVISAGIARGRAEISVLREGKDLFKYAAPSDDDLTPGVPSKPTLPQDKTYLAVRGGAKAGYILETQDGKAIRTRP